MKSTWNSVETWISLCVRARIFLKNKSDFGENMSIVDHNLWFAIKLVKVKVEIPLHLFVMFYSSVCK